MRDYVDAPGSEPADEAAARDVLGAYYVAYDDRRVEVGPAAAIAATLAAATAPAAAGGLPPAQQAALARALVAAEVNRRHPLPRAELAAMCDAAPASLAAVMHAALAARWPAALDGWTLEAVLGRGGFGTVYRARRATAVGEEVVALKRLNPGVEPEPPLAVRHPRVLVPRWTTTPAGETYGTMPLVEGESLADYLSRYRAARALPPLPEVLRLTREMAELLVLVHPHALHRDLKPANVLLDGAGRVSLADFGLALVRARRLRDEGRHERAGTLLYMAPEALLSEREPREPHSLTAAADVWSVGVMLYELLTGEHPFGDDLESLLANVDGALCEDPRVRRPDLPAAVAELCLACLQAQPKARPRSAQALLERLRQTEREIAPPVVPSAFANRYHGTDHEPAPFGGRTAELAELHDWLDHGPEPYALLCAPMGRGKSALCWHFVQQVRAAEAWHVVFVPISLYAGTADPSVFLRTLVTHVAQLQGRALPAQASTDEWDRLWREVFAEGVPAGRPVLLVIDGLDEARGWAPDANFLPDLSRQSVEAAAPVRVLVAARDPVDGRRWRRQLGWTAPGLSRGFALARLDGPGLLQVFASLGQPLDRLPEPARWQQELLRLTEGEPLLARLYALDLRARALRRVPVTLGELEDRAPGLDAYIEEWREQQGALWRARGNVPEADVDRLLDLLAVACGPLTLDNLATLFGVDVGRGRVAKVLEAVQRFVVGDGSVERPVAFGHPALAEHFATQPTQPAVQVHARYVEWGHTVGAALEAGRLQAQDVPQYLLAAFRYHLRKAQAALADWDALLAIRWTDASLAATGSYDGVLTDIDAVWDAIGAATPDDDGPGAPRELARLVRCALLKATMYTLHLRIPPALAVRAAELGNWSAARLLTYCADYDLSNSPERTGSDNWARQLARVLVLHSRALVVKLAQPSPHRLLVDVAVECVATRELSVEQTEELVAALAHADVSARTRLLEQLVARKSAPPAVSMALVETLPGAWGRAQALGGLAPYLPPELLPRALAAAEALGDERAQAQVLGALAPHLPPALLPRALAAAEALRNGEARLAALRALAPHVPNGPARALAAAEALGDKRTRAHALGALAPHLPPALLPRALAAAEALGSAGQRAQVLGALAPYLPPELWPRALAAAEALGDERTRAQVLGALAPHLPPELLPRALAAAEALGNDEARLTALAALAPHLPPELLPRTLAAAEALGNAGRRAQVLGALAPHLPPALLPHALAAAEALGDEWARAQALAALTPHLPPELLPRALAAAEALGDERAQAQVLGALAPHLPPALLPRALAAAEALRNGEARLAALRALAPHVPNGPARALAAAEALGDEWTRAHALAALMRHLPPELLPRALAAAEALGSAGQRAQVLGALAPYLPPELWPRALAAAEALGDERTRAQVLGALAPHLPPALLPRALAAAEALGSAGQRAQVLGALAPYLPPELWPRALAAAEALGDERAQAQVLGALAPHLPPELLPELLPRALAAAEALGDDEARLTALAALAPHLPPALLPRALAAAEAFGDTTQYAKAFAALALHFPNGPARALAAAEALGNDEARLTALAALAPHLPPALLPRALAAAEALGDDEARLTALAALAPHLPPELLSRTLAAAELGGTAWRAQVLGALAPHLPPALLPRALAAAEALGDDEARLTALAALAPHLPPELLPRALAAAEALEHAWARLAALPALTPHLPTALLPRVLAAAEALGDVARRAQALVAIAPYLPPELLPRALAAAEALGNAGRRAQVLGALAPHLPPALLPHALAAAEALGDEWARAQALAALTPHLPPELLPRALAAAEALGNAGRRAQVLGALAPHLPPALLPRALAAAEALGDERARAQALAALTPHLPPELLPRALAAAEALGDERAQAQVLGALAPHLPPALLPRALAAAEALRNGEARLAALRALAPHVPNGPARALAAAEALGDEWTRAHALAALMRHLPPELLPRALAAAEALGSAGQRAQVLGALAPYLPPELWPRALAAAEALGDERTRAQVLGALAPHLPPALLPRALAAAEALRNGEARLAVIRALVPHLPEKFRVGAVTAAFTGMRSTSVVDSEATALSWLDLAQLFQGAATSALLTDTSVPLRIRLQVLSAQVLPVPLRRAVIRTMLLSTRGRDTRRAILEWIPRMTSAETRWRLDEAAAASLATTVEEVGARWP